MKVKPGLNLVVANLVILSAKQVTETAHDGGCLVTLPKPGVGTVLSENGVFYGKAHVWTWFLG